MSGMPPIDPATASVDVKEAFDEAKAQFGGVINLFKVAGNAPNVLMGILALNKSMSAGSDLDDKLTEQVAMLVSALNRCDYCVNVHMQLGKGYGLSEHDMLDAMAGKASNPKAQALLDYTNEVVRNRGRVSGGTMTRVRAAGLSNKALIETIGVIGLYTMLQYIRHVGDPVQDFPVVVVFDPSIHGADDGALFKA